MTTTCPPALPEAVLGQDGVSSVAGLLDMSGLNGGHENEVREDALATEMDELCVEAKQAVEIAQNDDI